MVEELEKRKRKRDEKEDGEDGEDGGDVGVDVVVVKRRRRKRIAYPIRRRERKEKQESRSKNEKREVASEDEDENFQEEQCNEQESVVDDLFIEEESKQEVESESEEEEVLSFFEEWEDEEDEDWIPLGAAATTPPPAFYSSSSAQLSSSSSSSSSAPSFSSSFTTTSFSSTTSSSSTTARSAIRKSLSKGMVRQIGSILEGNQGAGGAEVECDNVEEGGAKLVPPLKALTKKGVNEGIIERRKVVRKSTSLEELTKGIEKNRKKKAKEKERLEEAGWKRIENIQNWRWAYFRVPMEKRSMVIDLPSRSSFTRLGVFSLYFTDDLLSYLLGKREVEMATYWSSSGYGIKVNLQAIKQVMLHHFHHCLFTERIFIDSSFVDVGICHLHHWHQKVSSP